MTSHPANHMPCALPQRRKPTRRPNKPCLFGCFFALVLVLCCPPSAPLHAEPNQPGTNTLIILDGSGSMWGKIKDGHKFLIARKALAASTANFDNQLNLGLLAYGHRLRSACQDIQVLKPPAPLDSTEFSKLVNSVKPVGKTPITGALRKALALLNKSGKGGNIILLADGPENCRQNPCAFITSKTAKASPLKVHVIAFAMKPKEANSLACLAEKTGGQFLTATSQKELTQALTTALKASQDGTRFLGDQPSTPKTSKKPGLKLSAHLGPASKALNNNLNWHIVPYVKGKPAPGEKTTSKDPAPFFPLKEGRYQITANYKNHQAKQQISLKSKEHKSLKLVFHLSQLRFPKAWEASNSRSGFGKIFLTPQNDPTTTNSKTPSLIELTSSPEDALLPAGAYKLSAIENGKLKSWLIQAEAGKETTLPLWKTTGRLNLILKDSTGAQLKHPITRLKKQRRDKEQPANNFEDEIISTASAPQFDIEAGTYNLTIQDGHAIKQQIATVKSSGATTLTIELERAHLSIKQTPLSQSEHPSISIAQKQNNTFKHIITTQAVSAPLILAPGTYRITHRSDEKQTSTTKTINLAKGAHKTITFKTQTTPLALTISNRKDPLSRHQTFWRIFEKSGRLVWQSTTAEPTLNLPAGRYIIQAEIGKDQYRREVWLKGSSTTAIDLAKHPLKK